MTENTGAKDTVYVKLSFEGEKSKKGTRNALKHILVELLDI